MIICIGREFGSGGHEIGKIIAEKLGMELYDRDLIDKAAEKIVAMPKEVLEKADEKKHNPWLHQVWYDVPNQELNGMTANDTLHQAYSSIIRELAEKANCVFVGRCADYILEQANLDHISLFIAAPFEWRVQRKMEQLSIDEKAATSLVRKKDKDRKAYYDYYTGRSWGRPHNYDLCINSSRLGIEVTAEKLVEMIRELEKANCVFVGRCADYILEQANLDHISLFIAAPFEWRVQRKMEQLSIDEKAATSLVRKKDKDRKAYYDYYTGRSWGRPHNYDLCINSSRLGIEVTAEKLVEMIRELEKAMSPVNFDL